MLNAVLAVSGPISAEPQPAPAPALAPLTWSLQAAPGAAPPEGDLPPEGEQMPPDEVNEIVVEGAYGPPEGDPAEKLNAESYRITQAVDEAVIEPVAYAYRDGLPEPLRDGLGNVVRNLGEPSNALNFLLQGKIGKAFGALGRLAINSTLGLGGLIDIAGKPGIGIPYRRNGFANTKGFYGVESGQYLYLPVTGATSLRDIIGSTLDQALLPVAVGKPFNQLEYAATYFVINGLDQRLEVDAELAEIRASDDPYAERRDTYLSKREREIAALKGEIVEDEPEVPVADEAQPEPADPQTTAPDQPPLSLVEQVQLTARTIPAIR